jgi:hypothetical protein
VSESLAFSPPLQAPELPRDEMAFRQCYQRLLLSRRLTTVFRPGDRLYPNWRGYIEGETVTARIIVRSGCDALGIAPRFSAVRRQLRIERIEVLPVNRLTWTHFEGSSPDVYDPESLLEHLRDIYGQPISAYGDKVTRISFSHLREPSSVGRWRLARRRPSREPDAHP